MLQLCKGTFVGPPPDDKNTIKRLNTQHDTTPEQLPSKSKLFALPWFPRGTRISRCRVPAPGAANIRLATLAAVFVVFKATLSLYFYPELASAVCPLSSPEPAKGFGSSCCVHVSLDFPRVAILKVAVRSRTHAASG